MFFKNRAKVRVHWFDYAFLMTALVFICGGCLMALDLAASYNAGQESSLSQMLTIAQEWQPVVWERLCTGALLLAASVVNSALMTVFVQMLRLMDRKVSRSRQRHWRSQKTARPATVILGKPHGSQAAFSGYLLNPLMR